MLLSSKAHQSLDQHKFVSNRIIRLQFSGKQSKDNKTHLVVAYAPTSAAPSEDKESFYHQLETATADVSRRFTVYILADMKARFDHRFAKYPCSDEATDNGEGMADFMANHNMLSTMCTMRKSRRQWYTHTGPRGFKWRIDHLIARDHYRSSVLNCKLFTPSAPRSDHRLLMVARRLRFATPTKPKFSQRRDFSKLQSMVEEASAELNTHDNTTSDNVTNAARSVVELVLKIYYTKRDKPCLDADIVETRNNLNAARKHLRMNTALPLEEKLQAVPKSCQNFTSKAGKLLKQHC